MRRRRMTRWAWVLLWCGAFMSLATPVMADGTTMPPQILGSH